jgi:hypothetical protein
LSPPRAAACAAAFAAARFRAKACIRADVCRLQYISFVAAALFAKAGYINN